jgi:hypothetical protein
MLIMHYTVKTYVGVDVSGQLDVPAALLPGKAPSVPIGFG